MTVIKINAITVPADGGDELARRFAARAGAVDAQDGFEGFELLRPSDGRATWLVVTRWRDEAAFEAWRTGPAFGHAHGHAGGGPAGGNGHGHEGGGHGRAHGHENASGAEHAHARGQPRAAPPVAVSSELWSFEIAGGSAGQQR
jgi:heme oxygenase (mycobilin-producing)